MKKITLLLAAAALTLTASATVQSKPAPTPAKSRLLKDSAPALTENKRAAAPSRVITEQPEGEVVTFTRQGEAFIQRGSIDYVDQSGDLRMVMASDGTVYIENLMFHTGTYYGTNWVTGHFSEDRQTLIVPTGQEIYHDETNGSVKMYMGTTSIAFDDNGVPYVAFTPDLSITEVTYTISEDGETLTLNGTEGDFSKGYPDGYCVTGLGAQWTDLGIFTGFIEWNTVFTHSIVAPPLEVITEQPAGEVKIYYRSGGTIYGAEYGLSAGRQTGKFKIVFAEDGETVYIESPLYSVNGANWVKGTLNADGTKITVPLGQCVYWDSQQNYGLITAWGRSYIAEGDGDGLQQYKFEYNIDKTVTEMTYSVDNEAQTITLDNTTGDLEAEFPEYYNAVGPFAIWNDDLSFYTMDFITAYNLVPEPVPTVPADPKVAADAWFDCGDERGYSYFEFTLPTTDVDGKLLNDECMSYSIYTDDDQLFTFDTERYSELNEDATEIPYEVFYRSHDLAKDIVWFYRTNEGDNPLFERRIGIQVHYIVLTSEGEVRNSSNIVYWNLAIAGDVNGDGVVDIADINAVINIMLGKADAEAFDGRADVTGDGNIDVADINAIINIMLGK